MDKARRGAIFLDRDGVINEEIGDYVTSLKDFKILAHVRDNLKQLQAAGYKIIVVTNQGGLAKGLYTPETLDAMHRQLAAHLAEAGVHIDDIYYCPHHPHTGNCICRKPGSLLVEKALAKHHIDPARSVFIGDKPRDVEAAEGAGVRGMLIDENQDWSFIAAQMLKGGEALIP